MHYIKYVIVSVPRSGTGYTAKVFNELGLNCGHEGYFSTVHQRYGDPELQVFGDSSWLAAPFIGTLPPGTMVLHQVRDPLVCLNSNLKPQNLQPSLFTHWDQRPLNQFSGFVWDHTRDWVWPATEEARLGHFWVNWHLRIEYAATRRSDLRYGRFRVEDMDVSLTQQLAKAAGPTCWGGQGPSIVQMHQAIEAVPHDYNHQGEPGAVFKMDNLSQAVRDLARRYGYHSY